MIVVVGAMIIVVGSGVVQRVAWSICGIKIKPMGAIIAAPLFRATHTLSCVQSPFFVTSVLNICAPTSSINSTFGERSRNLHVLLTAWMEVVELDRRSVSSTDRLSIKL
jgi:hypothetical protein